MAETTVDALIVDLLLWLSARARTYPEVLEAWRTSCPRLPVWEEANDRRLVCCVEADGREFVRVTATGIELLESRGLQAHAGSPSATLPVF